MKKTQHEQQLFQYMTALDKGDADGVLRILAQAETDPDLDRLLMDLDATCHHEAFTIQQEKIMTTYTPTFAPTINPTRGRSLSLVAVLIVTILIGGLLIMLNERSSQMPFGATPSQDAVQQVSIILEQGKVAVTLPLAPELQQAFRIGDRLDVIVAMLYYDADSDFQTPLSAQPTTPEGEPIRAQMMRAAQHAEIVWLGDFPPEGEETLPNITDPESVVIAVSAQEAEVLTWVIDVQMPFTLAPALPHHDDADVVLPAMQADFQIGGMAFYPLADQTQQALQSAKMTWVGLYMRPNQSLIELAQTVESLHQAGFRVLVSASGNVPQLERDFAGYQQEYARWVSEIAKLGADAIEVWSEPNLDRNWISNAVSVEDYVQLLQVASQAIRASNPETMIISGGLAPTGAEAAFPGQVINDDRFMREFVEAGGAEWVDCIGVHYLEGIVPPDATEGDSRDDYYTRYLPTMLETYTAIVQGQRPLCFTEYGYLSNEGFSGLPIYFEWARDINNGTQAWWLERAAKWLQEQDNVRLMMIYNVDATYNNANGTSFETDPQAGFAIIRGGDRCLVCMMLATIEQ